MIIKSYEIQKNISKFFKYNLILLYGENDGLKKDIKDLIRTNINKQDPKTEYISLYENEVIDNKDNLYNSIFSGSLFGDKKIIIINGGTDKTVQITEDIIDKCPENIFIIILSSILEKKSKLRNFFEKNLKTLCIPCYLDEDRDLKIIAINEFKKENIKLSNESISLLIEKSNKDRLNLRNEIEKIKLFAAEKKNLELDEIKAIINFSGEHKSDILINECLCGNISQFRKILSDIYMNTVNQIFLLRILSNKIQRLLSMKELEKNYSDLENLINSSKPPVFWKEKPIMKKQLTIWDSKELKKTINEINNTELLCKKNPKISKIIFFDLFTKICKKANSFS